MGGVPKSYRRCIRRLCRAPETMEGCYAAKVARDEDGAGYHARAA